MTRKAPLVTLGLLLSVALAACGSTVRVDGASAPAVSLGTPDTAGLGTPASGASAGSLASGGTATATVGQGSGRPAASGGAVAGAPGAGSAAGSPSGSTTGGSGTVISGPASAPASTSAGSTAPNGGGGTTPTPSAPAQPTGGGGLTPSTHPGVDDTTIRIGLHYISGGDEFVGGLGVAGYALGDGQKQAQAVADHVNANGGVGGRQLQLLPYPYQAGQPIDPQMQAACEFWTVDNKIAAMVPQTSGVVDTLYDCLGQADVAYVQDDVPGDRDQFERFPNHLYAPGDAVRDDLIATEITALVRSGFLSPDKVIGINRTDLPSEERIMDTVVRPLFTEHGLEIAADFAMNAMSADFGLSQIPSAVLQFRAAGVDTVYDLTSPLFFMLQADSQGYAPDYSVNSYMGPGSLLETAAPESQLDGVQGIGWIPGSDLSAANNPGPVNDTETLCIQMMEDAGQDMSSPVTRQVALWLCGEILFLDAAWEAAPEISPAGLAAGMRGDVLYVSPWTWRTVWEQGRRDGLGSYRDVAYDSACGCFAYTSDQSAFR